MISIVRKAGLLTWLLVACSCSNRLAASGTGPLDASANDRSPEPKGDGDDSGDGDGDEPGDGEEREPDSHGDGDGDDDDDGGEASDAGSLESFNGMCESARWANVSDECWSCWCQKCSTTLNVATRGSMAIFECMVEQDLLVSSLFEILCEIRAGEAECVNGATEDWNKLKDFDSCLIQSIDSLDEFRGCDSECASNYRYTGDVCTRYP